MFMLGGYNNHVSGSIVLCPRLDAQSLDQAAVLGHMSMIFAILATPLGRYALIALIAVVAVGAFALYWRGQGEAAAAAAAAALALERSTAAARARAKVKHTPEAINADPHNRDLR